MTIDHFAKIRAAYSNCSVLGVPRVPEKKSLDNKGLLNEGPGTPQDDAGVLGVPNASARTPGTPPPNSGVPPITSENANDFHGLSKDGTLEHLEHCTSGEQPNFHNARNGRFQSERPEYGEYHDDTYTVIDRIARLDAERNERDCRAGRGYDYAQSSLRTYTVHVSSHIDFVTEADSQFDLCETCGDPAGMVLPLTMAVRGGKRHFCGTKCLAQVHDETATSDDEDAAF
jgi:hypothetical protein